MVKRRPASHVPSLTDVVYDELRRTLLKGEFPPGYVLRQEELAERLGTSRVPLREAMRRLSAEGMLVLRPRRGYAVTSLAPAEIEELFELRAIVEAQAGRVAARMRNRAQIEQVRRVLVQMDTTMVDLPHRAARWLDLNMIFHDTLFAAAGRGHLSRISSNVRNLIEPYIRIELALVRDVETAQREHHAIFKAFEKGDEAATEALCKAHCESTARRLLKRLRPSGLEERETPVQARLRRRQA